MNQKDINERLEKMMEDVGLRAEFEFEEVWRDMKPAGIDDEFLVICKKVMKHGYITGAKSAVLIMMEKVAQDLCE